MYTAFTTKIYQSNFHIHIFYNLQDHIYKSIYKTKLMNSPSRSVFFTNSGRRVLSSHSVFVKVAESSCEVPPQRNGEDVDEDEERERVK